MGKRTALILIAAFACLTILTAWSGGFLGSKPKMASTDRPVVTVKARVLDSMVRYANVTTEVHEVTGLKRLDRRSELTGSDHHDEFLDYLVARASDGFTDDPGGIVIHYDHPTCPVVLPAGRQFKFSHVGGYIDEIEAIFPLEPLSWDDMQIDLQAMIKQLDDAGWVRTTGHFTSKTPVQETITFDDFLNKTGPKWASVGFWGQCDAPENIKVYLQVRHFNSGAAGSFMPPAALSKPIPEDAEDKFIFLMRFQAEVNSDLAEELVQLRDARRVAHVGDPEQRIPLSVWLDDPDWRPEGWDGKFLK